ncbi:hypothetical protein BV898_16627 [Hypsibius exemplaris]|uniref:Receptor ligand binding region domain-containing protein n=1 Tax=Hypsibius exemplaris TaxID=2072580 RepID=A0A9X6NFP8_HYPEX|nr:hypothetical protein BV898_16627 [Hypsibius exemplaris]
MALIIRARSGTTTTTTKLRMGIVLTTKTFMNSDFSITGPAIALAINRSKERFNVDIEPYLSLFSTEETSECRATNTVVLGRVVQALQSSVDVILGPSCTEDFVLASKLATVYKVPLLTGAAVLLESSESWVYVSRTGFNVGTEASFFTLILKQFGWRHVAVIYEANNVGKTATGQSKLTIDL